MRNLIKYGVSSFIVLTGSVASAWWCSTCGEDHKDGDPCEKTGKKPCDRCHGIQKPGGECPQVFSSDENLWEEEPQTPGQKEFSEKEKERKREKRKKDFREAENKLKELKLSERELTCLLSFIQGRMRESGTLVVRLDNGVLGVPWWWESRVYCAPRGQVLGMSPNIQWATGTMDTTTITDIDLLRLSYTGNYTKKVALVSFLVPGAV